MGAGDSGSRPDRAIRRARPSRVLKVAVVDAEGRRVNAGGLARWLARLAPRRVSGTVSVALVADARVRRLNRTYRATDYVTDVLSFSFEPTTPASHLGDIVIATGVATRQARSAGHSTYTELRILALHGLLHLIGYDHETDNGAMERLERRLRLQGGLREGLIERGSEAGGGTRKGPKRLSRSAREANGATGVARASGSPATKRARPGEGPRSKK